MKTLRQKIEDFAKAHNLSLDEGYFIVWYGKPEGWTRELDEPQAWKPWTIAHNLVTGECYRAEGGDDYNGANKWTEI